jgi:Fe2+ or Zn2+ uptake regulation protein
MSERTPPEPIRRTLLSAASEDLAENSLREPRQRSAILEQLITISREFDVEAEILQISKDRDIW